MFVLYKVRDKIDIPPEMLSQSARISITTILEKKYIKKVLKSEGICIAIYELVILETFLIEDITQCHIEFTLILFKPFIGEVLNAVIKKCTKEGIIIDLTFFEAFIPNELLFENTYL